ncbi:hypothetical protein C5C39_02645 [Rathayibacter sp. AY1F3]|uniref:beta-galactosidase n=1 Tax=Rathayibacter sp. AY1F3 TaxID=2080558 RepID=UPI000CE79149|nr:beta-galactosidase [Rathayibacter sp. AY1F3]PPG92922.1 hypothetical protein C5C39_02645 [Rathayibacter sp. AY1F3]
MSLVEPGALPISGEVQFWRMEPEEWEPALRAVQEIGIDTVATYLSWRRHEPVQGTLDLRGTHAPELDVHRFLRLCRERGLRVILKPGPWICAEEPNGGLPDWVVADDALIALDHRGEQVSGYNPPFKHPMPSCSSRAYRALVERWIRAVWSDLAEFLGEDGPVVGTQYDNEPSLGFQDSMHGFDWHPDALADWHRFIGGTVEPPRPRTGPPESATALESAWAHWHRVYFADYLAWLREVTADAGAAVLAGTINLNTHPVRGWPQDGRVLVEALEGTVVGEDHYYVPPLDDRDLAGLALAVAQARASATPLVWSPEMQAGIWRSPGEVVDYPDPTVEEQVAWWGAALALGYQGFNLYMLVDRENWEHAPITRSGVVTPLGRALQRMLRELRGVRIRPGSRPLPATALEWDDLARVDAYRVRGTQSAPDTAWDSPAARRRYDAVEKQALEAVRAGRQFDLGGTASGVAIEAPAGFLVRAHEDAQGAVLLYVVRLPGAAVRGPVELGVPLAWRAVRRADAQVRCESGRVVLPAAADVFEIWSVEA